MSDEERDPRPTEIEMVGENESGLDVPLPIHHVDFEMEADDLRGTAVSEEVHERLTEISGVTSMEFTGLFALADGGDLSEMDPDELLDELSDDKDSRSHEGPPTEDGEPGEVYVDSTTGDIYAYDGSEWVEQEVETTDPSDPDKDDLIDAARIAGEVEEFSITTEVDEMADPDFVPGDGSVASAFRKLADFESEMTRGNSFCSSLKHADDPHTPIHGHVTMNEDVEDAPEYTTYEMEVDVEMTEELLERIGDEVEKRERQGYTIDQLVLGLPQYKVLQVWAQDNYGQDAEAVIPVEEVIVVPGPIIWPVVPNRRALSEHMAKEGTEK